MRWTRAEIIGAIATVVAVVLFGWLVMPLLMPLLGPP